MAAVATAWSPLRSSSKEVYCGDLEGAPARLGRAQSAYGALQGGILERRRSWGDAKASPRSKEDTSKPASTEKCRTAPNASFENGINARPPVPSVDERPFDSSAISLSLPPPPDQNKRAGRNSGKHVRMPAAPYDSTARRSSCPVLAIPPTIFHSSRNFAPTDEEDRISEDDEEYDNNRGVVTPADDELLQKAKAAEQQPVVWPERNDEEFERGRALLKTLLCDALSFDADDMAHLVLQIFEECGIPENVGITTSKLQRFIIGVRDRMLDNPYHNWTHIFDVTQTTYCLACKCGLMDRLSSMQRFALITSALCHDLEHPGVNNPFLVASRSDLATLYNDRSVLENHHCCRAFQLMLHSEIQLLSDFASADYTVFRSVVLNNILATDMARHGEYTTKLKRLTEAGTPLEERHLDSQFAMEVIIKCADTSNVLKPFNVAKKWAVRVTDEFFLQGDLERANGMEVTPTCDRQVQERVALQKGFYDFVIGPYYSKVAALLPELASLLDQIKVNREMWNSYDDKMLMDELGSSYLARLPGIGTDGPLKLSVATWNVAAVNNNPFEYWITHQSGEYAKLMNDVQRFVDNPGGRDFVVSEVLTDEMFAELKHDMSKHGFPGLDELERRWVEDYRDRCAISGFLKDKAIGSKRLVSMPDRITNTINSDGRIIYRPSVISGFEGEMGHIPVWWQKWREYTFRTDVHTLDRLSPGAYKVQAVCKMIEPIRHAKYPAITMEEEAISIPLQVLALAIFDCVLVRMLQIIAPRTWQPLKHSLCDAFNKNKSQQVINILAKSYDDADIIFIQEAAASFVDHAKQGLGSKYMVLRPYVLDGYRNQNSMILARKDKFIEGSRADLTEQVGRLAGGRWTAPGDLCAIAIKGVDGSRYLLASFHGDTNGLATIPVLKALNEAFTKSYPDHIVIFGLDANTHKQNSVNCQGIADFQQKFSEMGFASCWGPSPGVHTWTTRNARTYLQPQLQKAVGISDAARKGEVNLKDWIIFYGNQMQAVDSARDNTGNREFAESMVFPTLKSFRRITPLSLACLSVMRTTTTLSARPLGDVRG
uniref:Phosphodiesterase n=1 Tax=Hemiselmis andersenii TaxID=464988 RepID=A0A7S1HN58_HEMAN